MEQFYPVHSQQEGECQCDRKTLKTRREHVDLRFKSCHLDIYLWGFFLIFVFKYTLKVTVPAETSRSSAHNKQHAGAEYRNIMNKSWHQTVSCYSFTRSNRRRSS